MLTLAPSSSLELRSATGQRWQEKPYDPRMALFLQQRYEIPEMVARILAARGIPEEEVSGFLSPTLREGLPDPSTLPDMDAAADRLAQAVIARETIGIFGDYDVDGATSTAVLMQFFRMLETPTVYHIPDRQKEGYGPNLPALQAMAEKGASVIITVDCGTTAHTPLNAIADAGVDVIVADHHIGEPELPRVYAVVNPNRFDAEGLHGQMAAVGVCFLLAVATNRALRKGGYYTAHPEPDLLSLLDRVALGTVADVVPLTGVNRVLVSQGLQVLRRRQSLGLTALMDVAGVQEVPDAYHLGFILGPRINAGGRVGDASLGVRLLTGTDPLEVREIAERLHQLNAERQTIEALTLEEALAQAERTPPTSITWAVGQGWHEGVIGIVAGRLKERFHLPSIVVTFHNGIGKASARSVTGVDIGSAITSARHAGLLLAGGGHAMAGGFTVEEAKLAELQAFLEQRIAAKVAEAAANRVQWFEATVTLPGVTLSLVEQLSKLAPFGTSHPEPRILIPDVRIFQAESFGNGHVRCWLGTGGIGRQASSSRMRGIAFRVADQPLGAALLSAQGRDVQVLAKLRINHWQGNSRVDVQIEDVI
jgi:single-stranded-DNA-specific exonuclease